MRFIELALVMGGVLFAMASASSASARPRLPAILSDHMVIQRGRPIAVWGWGDSGERVTVTLAGRSAGATADANGAWRVELPAMDAGGPYTMTVAGSATLEVRDVLVGEVWVASGQSNMEYELSRDADAATLVPAATNPELRLFRVARGVAFAPREDLVGEWVVCRPDAVPTFSAVAYVFGRELATSLDVPVGMIETCWSGTEAESWTDAASLAADPELRPAVERWQARSAEDVALAEHGATFDLELADFELLPKDGGAPVRLSRFEAGRARTTTGGTIVYSGSPSASFRLEAPEGGGSPVARVAGSIDATTSASLVATFAPGGASADLSAYSGLRFRIRGAGAFQVKVTETAIFDFDDYVAPPERATSAWRTVTVPFSTLKQAGWGVVTPFQPNALTGVMVDVLRRVDGGPPLAPSSLFNAMIAPLTRFPIRGAIWYQGESNAGRADQYRRLLPAMIRGWRTAWGDERMPFGIVQLPNFGEGPNASATSEWAELREAQAITAKADSNVGLAVTIDLGRPENLHPPRKREIGERLARWAEASVYGAKGVVASGPVFRSSSTRGSSVVLSFDDGERGLAAVGGGALRGFVVAGEDRVFHPAVAEIDGATIVVSSPDVHAPVSVRYAWAGSPAANLGNRDGLMASPFRTDDWKR